MKKQKDLSQSTSRDLWLDVCSNLPESKSYQICVVMKVNNKNTCKVSDIAGEKFAHKCLM